MAAWPCNPSKDFAAFQDARARMQLLFFSIFSPVTRVSLFAGSIPLVPGSISLVPGCISLSLSLDGTEMLGLLRQMARSDLCLLASQPAPFPCLTFLSFFALSSSLSLFFFVSQRALSKHVSQPRKGLARDKVKCWKFDLWMKYKRT